MFWQVTTAFSVSAQWPRAQTNGDRNHAHFVSWRTFICPRKCRFAAATRDQVIRRQADTWYRKVGSLPGAATPSARKYFRADTGLLCTAALFVMRYFPTRFCPDAVADLAVVLCVPSSAFNQIQTAASCFRRNEEEMAPHRRRDDIGPTGGPYPCADAGFHAVKLLGNATISWKSVRARSVNAAAGRYAAGSDRRCHNRSRCSGD